MSDESFSYPERLDLSSADIASQKRLELLELFPEVLTEGGKIDFDRLKSLLGEMVDAGRERYSMIWPGKADCMQKIHEPSLMTLLPLRKESVDWETTQNVIIEGENLHVLKLLQKSYMGKVKMIYIDPPYNTLGDFVYPDNFAESKNTYYGHTGQSDADGRKFGTVTDTDGRIHSGWLNMMYPRLSLARNLLRKDGVIFISIDDHELPNLRKLCDEIYGEENFLATVVWQKKYAATNDAKGFSTMHDYILVYQKSDEFQRNLLPRTDDQDKPYRHDDGDGRGPWRTDNLSVRSYNVKYDYDFVNPNTGEAFRPPTGRAWFSKLEKLTELDKDNRIFWGKDGRGAPQLKRYLREVQQGKVPVTWWTFTDAGHNDAAKKEVSSLFEGNSPFDTPKPTTLIKLMLKIATQADDIIVDFFAGSGSTGHAVMAQNLEDGGNRRFLLVQFPEPLDHPSFKSIAEVTRERVKRASSALRQRESTLTSAIADLGFRAFKTSPSNFVPWDGTASNNADEVAKQLRLGIENTIENRTPEDLLYEILLKSWGEPTLSLMIEEEDILGVRVFSIANGTFLICLEETVSHDFCRALAERKPNRIVMRESAFAGNDQLKVNAVLTFKAAGVTKFTVV